MKTIEIEKATQPLANYARDLDDEIIILTSKNEPVAAIVSLIKHRSRKFVLKPQS